MANARCNSAVFDSGSGVVAVAGKEGIKKERVCCGPVIVKYFSGDLAYQLILLAFYRISTGH
jgi:hypothetical protein